MKQKPDLMLYLLVGAFVGIIVSWIYLVATKNMDDFKPKPDDPPIIYQNVSIILLENNSGKQ